MSAGPEPPTTPTGTSSPVGKPVVRRRRGRSALYSIIGVVVVVVIVVAVGASTNWYGLKTSATSEASCATGVTLQGNGAQFVNPLMTTWTAAYHAQSGNLVNYVDGGSGTGITDFSEHPPLIDFAVTDDPLTPTELYSMPSLPLTLPIVGGALTIIYNLPGVTGHLNLTGAVLEEIYNGTITTWNAAPIASINPGVSLPSSTIVPVVRSDPAGTTYVLTDFLSQSSAWWATNVGKGISVNFPHVAAETAVKGNSLLISTVAKTSYAIGYSDLTDVLTYSTPLQYAGIENPSGHYIVPTIANTESAIHDKVASLAGLPASTDTKDWFNVSMVNANGATDYPLATFVYLYVYQAAGAGFSPTLEKSQVIVQWIHYVLSPGAQALANETTPAQLYYAALPSAVVQVDEAGVSTMTYNVATIPACK